MNGSIQLAHSKDQIQKAKARLAYQRATVRRLGFDVDPRFAVIANETLALMEDRLSMLLVAHAGLLAAQGRQAPVAARVQGAPQR